MRQLQLIGKRFQRLLVLKQVESTIHGTRWVCRCDCGVEKTIYGKHLTQGIIKSCGCIAIEDLTGQIFSYLTVIKQSEHRGGRVHWECACICGKTAIINAKHLKNGHTKSCGCYKKKVGYKHGQSALNRTREYQTWDAMIQRCTNEKCPEYKNYGGRGIRVCDKWLYSFENFYADMGKRPDGKYSIDRYPNMNGDYEPSNCRWATVHEQMRNLRRNVYLEYDGKRMIKQDWARELNVAEPSITRYLKKGKSFDWVYNYFKNKRIK